MNLRISILIAAVLCGLGADAKESDFRAAKVFFKQHCIRCHGPEKEKGDIRLDTLSTNVDNVDAAETWQEVLDVLNAGEMPPEDEPQPKTAELATAIGALTDGLFEARKRLVDSQQITIRRLNRREYANTIHELLGVPVDVHRLPVDGTLDGFDTIGDAHFMSTVQFERYLELGRQALDRALVNGPRPEQMANRTEPETGRSKNVRKSLDGTEPKVKELRASLQKRGLSARDRDLYEKRLRKSLDVLYSCQGYQNQPATKTGAILDISQVPFGGQAHDKVSVSLPKRFREKDDRTVSLGDPIGRYVARFRIGLTCKPKPGRRLFVNLIRTDAFSQQVSYSETLGTFEISRTVDDPHIFEIPFENKGDLSDLIALSVKHLNEEFDPKAKPKRRGKYTYPDSTKKAYVWVDWLEVEGPIIEEWPPPAWQNTMVSSNAMEIIERFATKAFRQRQPDPEYLKQIHGIFQEHHASGASFVDSIKEALAVVLACPSFVYLIEQPSTNGEITHPLSDLELASRLSYFLWSHPPDQQLYALAKDGRLKSADTLHQQVERMLNDPKSKIFIEAFVSQWLDLPWLDMIVVNKGRFPRFNESLRDSMRAEPIEFFRHLIRNDLSARNLIDSEFVVIDGLLAAHYDVSAKPLDGFNPVILAANSPRGGLLGQGAVLTMTGTGERTSPVERGVFVYSHLLGRSVPPPPPNVPQLEVEGEDLTIRDHLSAHVAKAQCASCHRRMDPLGFGLEHFDAIGRWRDGEKIKTKSSRRRARQPELPIDATGVMPDGRRKFDGHEQLKTQIMQDADATTRGLLKSFLTYALGRRVGFADSDLVERLHANWKQKEYGMRNLIHAIVQTKEFQSK